MFGRIERSREGKGGEADNIRRGRELRRQGRRG